MKTKLWKRVTALILTGLLAIAMAGCGGKEEQKEQEQAGDSTPTGLSGEYVYVPNFTSFGKTDENGYIGTTIMKGDYLYFSESSFEPESGTTSSQIVKLAINNPSDKKTLDIQSPEVEGYQSSLNSFNLDEEGNLYIVYHMAPPYVEGADYNYEDYTSYLVKYDSSCNKVYERDLKEMFVDQNNSYLGQFEIGKDGVIYAASNNVIYVIGADGTPIKNIPTQSDWISGFLKTEDDRIFFGRYSNTGTGMELVEIDTVKYAIGNTFKNLPDMNGRIASGKEGKLFVCGNDYLYEYDLESQTAEPILNWLDSYITADYVQGVTMLEDGNFMLYYQDWEKDSNELVKLTKTKASELPKKETIVVASLYGQNQGIEHAIVDFNKSNSQYKVVYKAYYDLNAEWTENLYNDTIKAMNMDLVSDNPPDIIDLSNINISTLADKGVLEDLYPYLEKSTVLKKEDFVPSVLNAYTYNGKLVTIPSSFSINSLIAKKSLVGDAESCTIEDLMALSAKYPDADLMQYATKQSVLSEFLMYNTKAFVDYQEGSCHFDTPEFIKILEFANTFDENPNYGGDYPTKIRENKILLGSLGVHDIASYQMYTMMMEEPVTCIGYPTIDGSRGIYLSGQDIHAITSKSAHKEGAWAFIEYYLTNCQDSMYMHGLSANADKLEEQFKEAMTPEYEKDFSTGEYKKDENGELIEIPKTTWGYDSWTAEIYAATQEEVDAVKELINAAKPYDMNDEEIFAIVNEEVQPFFKGQKSAQDVAKVIQSRVSIFISENS